MFFNTLGRRLSHVGIYIGDGSFVHAPARRGRVRVERMTDPYWAARYNGAPAARSRPPPLVASTAAVPAAVAVDAALEVAHHSLIRLKFLLSPCS